MAQGDDRHQADDSGEDDRRLDGPRRDVAERDGFVHPFEDREEDDGGRDVADREQDLEQHAHGDPCVESFAEDVVGVVEDRVVEEHRGDREDEGGEEPQTRDASGLLQELHPDPFP